MGSSENHRLESVKREGICDRSQEDAQVYIRNVHPQTQTSIHPKTNIFAPENGCLEDEISNWDDLCSGG